MPKTNDVCALGHTAIPVTLETVETVTPTTTTTRQSVVMTCTRCGAQLSTSSIHA